MNVLERIANVPPRYLAKAILRLSVILPGTLLAATPGQECTAITDTQARLSCYDRAFGLTSSQPNASASQVGPSPVEAIPRAAPSYLSQAWELDPADKRGTFKLVQHRLNYLLPVLHTTSANTMPGSPAPGHQLASAVPIDDTEAKFQLSFRVKAWENVFGDNGDLWLGFTQQSNWQAFNEPISAPFRETNYEPELIFSFRTDADILGWKWRLLNLGFVHQSNGRALPLSRSWNRIYAQAGLERKNFLVFARAWHRLRESDGEDDNPDIQDYLGSGDLRLVYEDSGHFISALGRYSLPGKRGSLQLEWAFPIAGDLKGYLQLTNGYGASLIDYNHSQTTIGVGFLLLPWR